MNKYRVESARMPKYDYTSPGSYFITICTKNHNCIFGHVSIENSDSIDVETGLRPVSLTPKIILSPEGRIIHRCWYDLPNHYKNIILDEFIIMPDHLHGIIVINRIEGTLRQHGIPEFIRAFKSFSSRRINELYGKKESIWQPSYFDHVIKTDNELDRIRYYIRNNPVDWIKRYGK